MTQFAYKSLINFARSHQKHINFYFAFSRGAFICLCEHSHYFYDTKSCWMNIGAVWNKERQRKIIEKEKYWNSLKTIKKFIYLKSCLKESSKRQKSSLEWKLLFNSLFVFIGLDIKLNSSLRDNCKYCTRWENNEEKCYHKTHCKIHIKEEWDEKIFK